MVDAHHRDVDGLRDPLGGGGQVGVEVVGDVVEAVAAYVMAETLPGSG
jgi:hypothetical protein